MSLIEDPALAALIGRYFARRARRGDLSWDGLDADANRFMADKIVALEPEKAELRHLFCRSLRAVRTLSRPRAAAA